MAENNFTKIGDILPNILKAFGLDRKIKERQALSLWPEVVGKEVASRTRAVKIEKGVLHVHVDHGAWMQELHFMEKKILQELQKKAPDVEIRQIRFSASAIEST
ncbi:MAG: DUF721 domain-containing protein [Candidatus Latescibacteria bacterium]|nr:DUF721 domain-containing protein [Candidatus Latescibacterota bacterium]NIM22666.1 DUF721 domain-containing protein [Candidatus Latescibacterota bacterium]NIM64955.1 DUF721 domain-containing protein [Candidatus Latescibacterota bacterium]NIO01470.1 DUF721 domain-containing protein [Candidatus Latescibacterota bacterium]NIO27980.1 DUF721 domain-containing protein [Candidatus Latescibacterota bacterium]